MCDDLGRVPAAVAAEGDGGALKHRLTQATLTQGKPPLVCVCVCVCVCVMWVLCVSRRG
ncbi:MAG: hypothetical protein P4L40_14125 [Terracidiphilus sp.]|nr:hypothetical protein [Terracidiphilus sp.]